MTFASHITGMSLAFSLSLVALCASCIAGRPIEFSDDENYPPSIISQVDAEYPSREIGQLDLDAPVESPEVPLEVIVRDPNIDQTLQYRIFLDAGNPPSNTDIFIEQDFIEPSGEVERPDVFFIPYDLLTAGVCHKIEVTVTSEFAGFIEPRRPVIEGDFDNRTWWIEVTDADNPIITVECQ